MFKLWNKLKLVKLKLKDLHKEEFASIKGRIDQARDLLGSVQNSLKTSPNSDVYVQEKACIENLRKWLKVDEIALRQKSRIQCCRWVTPTISSLSLM